MEGFNMPAQVRFGYKLLADDTFIFCIMGFTKVLIYMFLFVMAAPMRLFEGLVAYLTLDVWIILAHD